MESLDLRIPLAGDLTWPANFVDVGGTVFFTAESSTNGRELWKTDGTAVGTVMVKDIRDGIFGSSPEDLIGFNGKVYFRANDGIHGDELWCSDGTESGTVMVKNVRPGSLGSFPSQFTIVGGALFFTSNDGVHGTELWKSDGTADGTLLVWDITEGRFSSFPSQLVDVGGTLFFSASNGSNGFELWSSDGTAAGTVMVKDIRAGGKGSFPSRLTDVGGSLFFTANDGNNGVELWKSDGTSAGTLLVKDIQAGELGSAPLSLTDVNGILYFRANDGTHGTELWKSDGTADGTVMIKDILLGSTGSILRELIPVQGTLYFAADDGTHGWELWKSDGTEAGTGMVKEIKLGGGGSNLWGLTNVNGVLFFGADDGTNGVELWKSDGTADGTSMVKDIHAGGTGSYPRYLANVDGTLYFCAIDVIFGTELWKSDGTDAGTTLVKANADESALNFTIAENNKKTDGTTKVATIRPQAAYSGQTFTFNALTGTDASSFSIDSSGILSLASGVSLNFEAKSTYTFNITVTDSSDPTQVTSATVTVSVLDVNEAPVYSLYDGGSPAAPVTISNGIANLSLDESVPGNATQNGLLIGTISASDVDAGTTLSLQNDGKGAIVLDKTGAFGYNPATGAITVMDATKVSYESNKTIRLSFAVTDTAIAGDPTSKPITTKLTVVITLNDLNEAPTITSPSSFSIAENNRSGAVVGTVRAVDADTRLVVKQILTYSIVSQKDTANADVSIFSIGASSGAITIATAGALNYEANGSYSVVVRVTDNGSPNLYTEQSITINVLDINEAAVVTLRNAMDVPVASLTLSLASISNGTGVGRIVATDTDSGSAGVNSVTITDSSKGLLCNASTGTLTIGDKSKLAAGKTYRIYADAIDGSGKPIKVRLAFDLIITS